MQKLLGIGIIALGVYLWYGVIFEYNRYSTSNAMTERLEDHAAGIGNYSAANYYRSSRNGPSWLKMFLFGFGGIGCVLIGVGIGGNRK